MAVTLSAAPSVNTIRILNRSTTQDEAQKVFQVDGAMSDADIIDMLDQYDHLTNALIVSCKVGERTATGFKSSASSSAQNLVSAFMVLTFEKANPVNALKTVTKNFIVPAYIDSLRNSSNNPDVGTPGTGSLAARLGLLVQYLEDNLAYLGADGVQYPGGWTYAGGGFGTGNDVIDGQ